MNVAEMVVIAVAISVIGGIVSKLIKAKYEHKANKHHEKENTASDNRLAELEKRIIVLEQIVTSEGYELKQQFKNIDDELI